MCSLPLRPGNRAGAFAQAGTVLGEIDASLFP
jgi:hypothetical protein